MPLIQISSGRGPQECQLAVGLFIASVLKTWPSASLVSSEGSAVVKISGQRLETLRSALISIPEGVKIVGGTRLWRAKSPFRPEHGRANWYFQVSLVDDAPQGSEEEILPRDLKFDTFRSPGKGGQNVNKVETGVRVTHKPSGLTASSTTARTQAENKKLALERLKQKMTGIVEDNKSKAERGLWRQHDLLVRGDPVQTFEGLEFKLVEP